MFVTLHEWQVGWVPVRSAGSVVAVLVGGAFVVDVGTDFGNMGRSFVEVPWGPRCIPLACLEEDGWECYEGGIGMVYRPCVWVSLRMAVVVGSSVLWAPHIASTHLFGAAWRAVWERAGTGQWVCGSAVVVATPSVEAAGG